VRTLRVLGLRPLLLLLLAACFLVPILATVLYSLATVWRDGVVPDGLTLAHWRSLVADERAIAAIARSLTLGAVAVAVDLVIVVPAAYCARVRNPRLRPVIQAVALIPFCLPMLVIGLGMLRLVTQALPHLQGTTTILVLAHAAAGFPFVYWAVDAAMAAARIALLSEAAETCGAGTVRTLRHVVLPNIGPGIAAGGALALAFSLGEFALAQVLVGAAYETVPLWSAEVFNRTQSRLEELGVMTVLMFAALFAVSALLIAVAGARAVGLVPGDDKGNE
jgi:putative spermidine/putrescine transport system permease protein